MEGSGCLCYIISRGGRQSKGKKTVSILFLSQGQRGRKTLAQKFSPNTSSSMRDFASQSHTYMHTLHIGSNKHRHSISTLTKKAQTHTQTHTLCLGRLIFTRVRWNGPFRVRTEGCVCVHRSCLVAFNGPVV